MRARSHLLLLISVLFLLITVTAQQRANASTAKFTAEEAAQSSTNSELAKQSREAAGEDDQEQFKHSGSVQFVSRITGLSLEHAYWLSVLLNFAIVAGVIVWVSKKNLPALFRDRTASIQKAMQEARKASELRRGFPGWMWKSDRWRPRQKRKRRQRKSGSRLRQRKTLARSWNRRTKRSRLQPEPRVAS